MPRTAPLTADTSAGIVFALAVEADAFERLAEHRREVRAARLAFATGTVAGHTVAWCVSGVGAVAAEAATRQLIAGHRPRALVSAGFAGGLDPGLARGSVVRASRVIRAGDVTPIDLARLESTVTPLLIDMETHAVARVAAAAGLPCHSVRVISDAADESLPPEVAALAAARSPLRRLGAVVGALGRRPAVARDVWRLWEHAVVDSRTLAAAVADLIGRLP
jgi:adenosylhomocysteine nucleosidase